MQIINSISRIRNFCYYRNIASKRILQTKPYYKTTNPDREIHTFVSTHDITNLIWSAKTFYASTKSEYTLTIHNDGTLKTNDINTIKAHFPNSRIISREESNFLCAQKIKQYPKLYELRNKSALIYRLINLSIIPKSSTILYLDTDILFFNEPTYLLSLLSDPTNKKNHFNKDLSNSYILDEKLIFKKTGIPIISHFNAGLGIIQKESIKPSLINKYLLLLDPHITNEGHWSYEQTLMALASTEWGVSHLPHEYSLYAGQTDFSKPCRHYAGNIRKLMYKEGIKHLIRNGFMNLPIIRN